jgi:hypothetical protein
MNIWNIEVEDDDYDFDWSNEDEKLDVDIVLEDFKECYNAELEKELELNEKW